MACGRVRVKVSRGCLWNRLKFQNSAQKKSERADEQDRPDVAKARDEWRASQPDLRAERLVFIDERGETTDKARRYGRCPCGQSLVSSVRWGHWKKTTFVAALRVDGIAAPCMFEGQMDGLRLRAYVEQLLVPILRHDDIVEMDNLASHEASASAKPSRPPVHSCATCRPTDPTSTPSNSSSLDSKLCCEKPTPERSMPSL